VLPFSTDRLLLRQFAPSDAHDLFEYLSLASTYAYEPGAPVDIAEAERLAAERSQGLKFFAVELKSEHKLIGHIYLSMVEPKDFMTYELVYIFNPRYHNQGYATEAARAAIAFCFSDLGAHRIVANCNPKNVASWKLLERCGLAREALLRKNVFFRKDERDRPLWNDTYQYAILSPDSGIRE
jgi:ribosomal-protein-alanine N-acetyltransferase